MFNDYLSWDTPWELYFHALIFIPIIQRLIFLGEPALKAVQIHGHHLKWIFERLREIPKGYSIAAKFTVGLIKLQQTKLIIIKVCMVIIQPRL